jgi:hypothetical protein
LEKEEKIARVQRDVREAEMDLPMQERHFLLGKLDGFEREFNSERVGKAKHH